MMRPLTFTRFLVILAALGLRAETFQGKVIDQSGAAIPAARVAVVGRVGLVALTTSDAAGAFQIPIADTARTNLLVTAPGFETKSVPVAQAEVITLAIAPLNDSMTVA